jgi:hypothetical protein
MQHVYGHAEEYLPEAEMSPTQQVSRQTSNSGTHGHGRGKWIHLKHLSVGKSLH